MRRANRCYNDSFRLLVAFPVKQQFRRFADDDVISSHTSSRQPG
ncbi:hypothetical protein [Mucilaginibacter sp. OK283]|nr:hypothetical protein [Mucilaginibacter sp. OK283]